MSKHVIRSIHCINKASSMQEAKSFQDEAKKWLNQSFSAMLDNILSEFDVSEDYLFIERLEFSCPNNPWHWDEIKWKEELTKQFSLVKSEKVDSTLIFESFFEFLVLGVHPLKGIFSSNIEFEQYFLRYGFKLDVSQKNKLSKMLLKESVLNRLIHGFQKEFVLASFEELYNLSKANNDIFVHWIYENVESSWSKVFLILNTISSHKCLNELRQMDWLNEEQFVSSVNKVISSENETIKTHEELNEIGTKVMDIDCFHCSNAGLVLIGPFFKRLFSRCHLIRDDINLETPSNLGPFNDMESLQRAIGLLHFIATGELTFADEQIVLPKILCGIAIEESIQCIEKLNDDLVLEAKSLLEFVISSWDVLRNTSIEGFRESFLKRNGFIKEDKSQYLLQIEEKGFDILLDKLPWGFRMYKENWMTKVLITEWH